MQQSINTDETANELSNSLLTISERMKGDSTGSSKHLRDLKKILWGHDENFDDDETTRFLVFFLNMYLDKVFYNLTGDVPDIDGVTKIAQNDFLDRIQDILRNLSEALKTKTDLCPYYKNLGIAYLDTVKRINDGHQSSAK